MLSAVLSVDTLAIRCGSHLPPAVGSLWWGSPWDDPSFFREVQVLVVSSGEADYLTLWGSRTLKTAVPRAALPSHSSRVRASPQLVPTSALHQELTRSQSPYSTLTDPADKRQEAFFTIWDEMSVGTETVFISSDEIRVRDILMGSWAEPISVKEAISLPVSFILSPLQEL